MVSHWSLRDNKSPQVSRTLLCILSDLYNAVVWMVSTYPLIYKSSSPFINPLGLFQVHQPLLVSPPPSCSIVFFFLVLKHVLFTYICDYENSSLSLLSILGKDLISNNNYNLLIVCLFFRYFLSPSSVGISLSIFHFASSFPTISISVIVEGNEIGNPSSNPGRGCLCFTLCLLNLSHTLAVVFGKYIQTFDFFYLSFRFLFSYFF